MDNMIFIKLYTQIACAAVSVIVVPIFLLICKPLRISKRPEDRLFRILCMVCALFGVFNIIRDVQYLVHFIDFSSFAGLLSMYMPDLIFFFYVLLWRLFVDAAINGSIDRVKYKFKWAMIPLGVMLVLLGVVYYTLQLAQRDIDTYGAVTDKTEWLYDAWGWVYYIVAVAIIFGFIFFTYYGLRQYNKERKVPLFLRLDVFVIPWIVALIVQNIPPMFICIDSLCAFISLMLTYHSMRMRFKYMDLETDFYREDFLPYLKKYLVDNKFDDKCSIMRISCSDFEKGAEIIHENRPKQSVVTETENGDFFVVSAINLRTAFVLLDNCLKETAATRYPDLTIDSQIWIKKASESLDTFTNRVMEESRSA